MNKETNLRIHSITAKAALKFGSEAWVSKKREGQLLRFVIPNVADEATLEGSSCTSIMTCTGGCGYSF